ncbi:MAG: hypothetical protein D6E12_04215 [Desulfovibrio sp.]|nr:MAG: hypothetical protein D6E12_04215 [Desulfovibrio sp.]
MDSVLAAGCQIKVGLLYYIYYTVYTSLAASPQKSQKLSKACSDLIIRVFDSDVTNFVFFDEERLRNRHNISPDIMGLRHGSFTAKVQGGKGKNVSMSCDYKLRAAYSAARPGVDLVLRETYTIPLIAREVQKS